MLKLKNITKTYVNKKDSSKNVVALKDVSLELPRQGFVSILGPSGCGKTTLLNILGGLDTKYAGEFLVEGVSTKSFKPHDWDAYRNNHVGFVFQEYNLIPHQNIVKNVELVLTIAGASKIEARRNARKVLGDIGLQDKIMSNSNELSGGQKQRVAIARAIVNNPELVLADEPTSALDSKTSAQVMQILKEISKTKLVVMVTHNVELAKKYSSRIIRILDGKVEADENIEEPGEREEFLNKLPQRYKYGKSKMKLKTAAALSLKNLTSKKRRSILTVLVGSIGITCLAIILGIIHGSNKFAKDSYNSKFNLPVTIESEVFDFMKTGEFKKAEEKAKEEMEQEEEKNKNSSKINTENKSAKVFEEAFNNKDRVHLNNLNEGFMKYLLNTMNEDNSGTIKAVQTVRNSGARFIYSKNGETNTSSSGELFKEIPFFKNINDQLTFLAGGPPTDKNGVIIVLDRFNNMSEDLLEILDIKDKKEFDASKLLGKVVGYFAPNNEIFIREGNKFFEKSGANELNNIKGGIPLPIVGVAKNVVKENSNLRFNLYGDDKGMLGNSAFYYSNVLAEHILNVNKDSEIIKEQMKRDDFVLGYTGLDKNLMGRRKKQSSKEQKINNLRSLGYCDKMDAINIFMNKPGDDEDKVLEYIERYNNDKKDEDKIRIAEWRMGSQRTAKAIRDISLFLLLTIGLASLLTSLIMVALLEFISVLERTREIGILRSIGARKKDISRLFKSEAVIIGFFTGVVGVALGFLLTIPLNNFIRDSAGLSANTKLVDINIMIFMGLLAFSLLVNLIAGLIPAKIASRKDPIKILVGSNN